MERTTHNTTSHSRRLAAAALLGLCVAAVASLALVGTLFPYHPRLRGAYIVAAPLTAGYLLGLGAPAAARKRAASILAVCAFVLTLSLAFRGDSSFGPIGTFVVGAAGVGLTLIFLRLGLVHAGIGWNGEAVPREDRPGRLAALAGLGLAWACLGWAMFHPNEDSKPTRLMLTAIGARPRAQSEPPDPPRLAQYALSATALPRERGARTTGGYRFAVGVMEARPGEVLVNAGVSTPDGKPFGTAVWLTLDVDQSGYPDTRNDADLFDRGYLLEADPGRDAVLASADVKHLSAVGFFRLSQSAPAVRLRARLWRLQGVRADGAAVFRPVAETGLGDWDLTPRRYLRRQPFAGP